MFRYPVTLEKDGRNFLVTFKDVPEAITFGKNEKEAMEKAVDALETGLSFYVDARKALPIPSKLKRGQKTISPSPLESAKLGVYQVMMAQGVRKAELARRLGWHMPQVDRLFDLKHASKLNQIEAAARVLGCHIEVSVAS
jgi:antitoxin HicB